MLLAAAGAVGFIAHRFRISTVIGFLAVGLLLGPHGVGRLSETLPWLSAISITESHAIKLAAELGVAFLLFMIGIELSLDRLWRMRRIVFGLGGAQVVTTGVAIGLLAALWGQPPSAAIVLGAALALSSTAIVVQLLAERGQIGTPTGRTCFGILLFQDLAVVPVIFMVGVMGAEPATGPALAIEIALALGKAALAIGLILIVGRLLLRPVLRAIARTGSREAFLAAVLLTALGTASLTEMAGLSLALGAFLAGIMLAETEFRHQVVVDIEPFKGMLLGVFFVSIGIGLDLPELARGPGAVILTALGLITVKTAITYVLLRFAGRPHGVAIEAGLLLSQGGEFAFIVVTLALGLGIMAPGSAVFITLVVGLTMAVTPLLAMAGRAIAARSVPPDPAATALPAPGEYSGHVIIAGYGRLGRAVGELLDSQRIPHLAVDARAGRVHHLREAGAAVFYGDASRRELLASMGAESAVALVVTMDRPDIVAEVVKAAREAWPALPIHARVRDEEHARVLLEAGATHVTLEMTEASLQMGQALLIDLGMPDDAARDLVADRREAARQMVRGPA